MIRSLLLLTFCFLIICFNANAQVYITEISADSGQSESVNDGFIELYNDGGAPVDIGCWVLTNAEWAVVFPAGTIITPGQYFIIGCSDGGNSGAIDCGPPNAGADGLSCLNCDYPGLPIDFDVCDPANFSFYEGGDQGFTLSNPNGGGLQGDMVILFDNTGTIYNNGTESAAFYWSGGTTSPDISLPSTLGDLSSSDVAVIPNAANCGYAVGDLVVPVYSNTAYTELFGDLNGCNTSYVYDLGTNTWSTDNHPTPGADNNSTAYTWNLQDLTVCKSDFAPGSTVFTYSTTVFNYQAVEPNVMDFDGNSGSWFYNQGLDSYSAWTISSPSPGETLLSFDLNIDDLSALPEGCYDFRAQWSDFSACNGSFGLPGTATNECYERGIFEVCVYDDLAIVGSNTIDCSTGPFSSGVIDVASLVTGAGNATYILLDDTSTPIETNTTGLFIIDPSTSNGYTIEVDGCGAGTVSFTVLDNCENELPCPENYVEGLASTPTCVGDDIVLSFSGDSLPPAGDLSWYYFANNTETDPANGTYMGTAIIPTGTSAPPPELFSIAYNFDGVNSATTTAPNITAGSTVVIGASQTDFTFVGGNPGNAYWGQDWPTGALQTNEYYETCLTMDPCWNMEVTNFTFDYRRSAAGPFDMQISFSDDGFATSQVVGTAVLPNNEAWQNFDSGAVSFNANYDFGSSTNAQGCFRIYFFNNQNVNGATRIDNLEISGNLIPTPECFPSVFSGAVPDFTFPTDSTFCDQTIFIRGFIEPFQNNCPDGGDSNDEEPYTDPIAVTLTCPYAQFTPEEITVCEGENVTVELELSGISLSGGIFSTDFLVNGVNSATSAPALGTDLPNVVINSSHLSLGANTIELTGLTNFTNPACAQYLPTDLVINVQPNPTATATALSDITGCNGIDAGQVVFDFGTNGVYTYEYTDPDGNTIQASVVGQYDTLTTNVPGNYTLTLVSNAANCSDTFNDVANVVDNFFALPDASGTQPAQVCDDGVVSYYFSQFEAAISANNGFTGGDYIWHYVDPNILSGPVNVIDTTAVSPLTFNGSISLYFTYTDGNGCQVSAPYNFNASSAACSGCTSTDFEIFFNASDTTVCEPLSQQYDVLIGDPSVFTIEGLNVPANLEFQWIVYSDPATETQPISFVSENTNPIFQINTTGVNTYCIGLLGYDQTAFAASPLSFGAINTINQLVTDFGNEGICMDTAFTCIQINPTVYVDLNDNPAPETAALSDTYCQGDVEPNLPAMVNGNSGNWTNEASVVVTQISTASVGSFEYYFTATNTCEVDSFSITVDPVTPVSIIADPVEICLNSQNSFDLATNINPVVSASSLDISIGSGGGSTAWFNTTTGIGDLTTATAGNYSITVNPAAGACFSIPGNNSFDILLYDVVDVIEQTVSDCTGASANFDLDAIAGSIAPSGVNNNWYDIGFSPVASPYTGPNTTLNLVVEDANGCLDTAAISLEYIDFSSFNYGPLSECATTTQGGQPAAIFDLTTLNAAIAADGLTFINWTTSDNAADVIGTPNAYTANASSVYAQVQNAGATCQNFVEVQLDINPQPPTDDIIAQVCEDAPGSATIDLDAEFAFDVMTGVINTISWFTDIGATNPIVNPSAYNLTSSMAVYAVVEENGNNCTDTAIVSMTLVPSPIVSNPVGTTFCTGSPDSVQLTVDDLGDTYLWYNGNDTTNATLFNVGAVLDTLPTFSFTTDFYVVAVNAAGCRSDVTPITLAINLAPPPPVLNNATECVDNVTGTFDLSTIAGVSAWYNSDTIEIAPADYVIGVDTFYGTFNDGICESNFVQLITESCADACPTINSVSAINDQLCLNGSLNLVVDLVAGTDPYIVNWMFPDGSTSSGEVLSHPISGFFYSAVCPEEYAANYEVICQGSLVASGSVPFTVYSPIPAPNVMGQGTCNIVITPACPDDFEVTWVDDQGNFSIGPYDTAYAANYTYGSGNVTFTINNLSAPAGCIMPNIQSNSFVYNYNCACPVLQDSIFSHPISGTDIHMCSAEQLSIELDLDNDALGDINWVVNNGPAFNNVNPLIYTPDANVTCNPISIPISYEIVCDADPAGNISGNYNLIVYPEISAPLVVNEVVDDCYISTNPCPNFDTYFNTGSGFVLADTMFLSNGDTGPFDLMVVNPDVPVDIFCDTLIMVDNFYACPNCPSLVDTLLNGSPFNDSEVFVCEGQNLNFTLNFDDVNVTTNWFLNGVLVAASNTYVFTALSTGCTEIHTVVYETVCTDNGVVIETGSFNVNVYSAVTAPVNSNNGCTIQVNQDCPEFAASWVATYSDTTTDTGVGFSADVDTGQDGTIEFTIVNTDPNVPANCDTLIFTENFNCGAFCPTVTNALIDNAFVCEGEAVSLTVDITDEVQVDSFYVLLDGVVQFTSGSANANNVVIVPINSVSCIDTLQLEYFVVCSDDNSIVTSASFDITAFEPINASVVSNTGCQIQVSQNCPEYNIEYLINFDDTSNDAGIGNTVNVLPGQSGTVLFDYTYNHPNTPLNCLNFGFAEAFDCPLNCPELVDTLLNGLDYVGTDLFVCEGDVLDFELVFDDASLVNVSWAVDGSLNGVGATLNYVAASVGGCTETQTISYNAACIADNTVTFTGSFQVTVYPDVTFSTSSTDCSVTATADCPEFAVYFDVLSDANPPLLGNDFILASGEIDSVQFIVVNETLNVPAACDSTVSGNIVVDCAAICPQFTNAVINDTHFCDGDVVELQFNFVDDTNIDSLFISDSNGNQTLIPVVAGTNIYTYNAPVTSVSCTDTLAINYLITCADDATWEETGSFQVFIYADLVPTVVDSGQCVVSIDPGCPASEVNVSYLSTDGDMGNGTTFNAPANAMGTVDFTVTYANAPAALACQSVNAPLGLPYDCDCAIVGFDLFAQLPNDTTICQGDDLPIIINYDPTYNYVWTSVIDPALTYLDLSNPAMPLFTNTGGISGLFDYTLTVDDGGLCQASDEILITVNNFAADPVVSVDNATPDCGGDVTFTITNPPGDPTFTWYFEDPAIDPAAIIAEGPFDFNLTLTNLAEGDTTIWVMVSNGGCASNVVSSTVTVEPCTSCDDNPITFTLEGNPINYCGNPPSVFPLIDYVTVSGGNAPLTWTWNETTYGSVFLSYNPDGSFADFDGTLLNASSPAMNVIVTIEDALGCIEDTTFIIDFSPNPTANFNPIDTVFCAENLGDFATIEVQADGNGDKEIIYINLSNGDQDTLQMPNGVISDVIVTNVPGVYALVSISDATNCENVALFDTVTVVAMPSPSLTLVANQVDCSVDGDSIYFQILVDDNMIEPNVNGIQIGGTAVSAAYSVTDITVNDGDVIDFAAPSDVVSYNVTAINLDSGCSLSIPLTVQVPSGCGLCNADAGVVTALSPICEGNTLDIPITNTSAVAGDLDYNYIYVLTDAAGNYLEINGIGFDTFDLVDEIGGSGALAVGSYYVYGISYLGADGVNLGAGNINGIINGIGIDIASGACIDTASTLIEILPPPTAGVFSNDTADYCQEPFITAPYVLSDMLFGQDAGGVWTEVSAVPSVGGAFDAAAGEFDPVFQAVGIYEFQYWVGYPNQANCVDSTSVFVQIWDTISAVTSPLIPAICNDTIGGQIASVYLPDLYLGTTTLGGSWSISGANPLPLPSYISNDTLYTLGILPGVYTIEYTVSTIPGYACPDVQVFEVDVNVNNCLDCTEITAITFDDLVCSGEEVDFIVNSDAVIGTDFVLGYATNDTLLDPYSLVDFTFLDVSITDGLQIVFPDVPMPTNNSGEIDTLFIYSMLAGLPIDPSCRPYVWDTLFIYPEVNANIVPLPLEVCAYGDTIDVSFEGGVAYEWTDSTSIIGINDTASSVVSAAGIYSVIAYGLDSVCTMDVNFLINEVDLDLVFLFDPVVCAGDPYILNGSNLIIPASDYPIDSYEWVPATGVSDASIEFPIFTPTETTVYTLTITDTEGCEAAASFTINVNSAGGITMDGLPVETIGLCPADSAIISLPNLDSYNWVDDGNISTTLVDSVFVVYPPNNDGWAVVSGTFGTCVFTDSIFVESVADLTVIASASIDSLCLGNVTTLTANGDAVDYYWIDLASGDTLGQDLTIDLALPQDTSIVLSGVNGSCNAQDTINLVVLDQPSAENLYINCPGESAIIDGGDFPIEFFAPANAGVIQNGNQLVITTETSIDVTVFFGNNGNCADGVLYTVEYLEQQNTFSIAEDATICVDEVASFSATTNNPTASINWTSSGGGTFDIDTGLNVTYTPSLIDEGDIEIVAELSTNCETISETVVLTVLQPSVIEAVAEPPSIPIGGTTTLIASNGFGTYTWSPVGTLSSETGEMVMANPEVTMTYMVDDESGCTEAGSVTVEVLELANLVAPTAFSPNGDGFNDEFRITGFLIDKFNFQVYDRWGMKLFETSNISEGWDGTFKGEPQELGVYLYVVNYNYIEDDRENRVMKGNFTLLR